MTLAKRIRLFFIVIIATSLISFETIFDISFQKIAQHQLFFCGIQFCLWLLVGLTLKRILSKLQLKQSDLQDKQTLLSTKKIFFTVGMFGLALLVGFMDNQFNPLSLPENQIYLNRLDASAPLFFSLSTIIYAPSIEELVFRGFFFQLFFSATTPLNKFLQVFVSGIIFGLAHQFAFDWNLLIYCSLGWILGAIYLYTKNLSYSIVVHSLINIF